MYLSLYAVNQAQVQRLLSVKSLGRAQAALWLQLAILIVLSGSMMVAGLVMYAYFRGCDPILHGDIAQVREQEFQISVPPIPLHLQIEFHKKTLQIYDQEHTLERPFLTNSLFKHLKSYNNKLPYHKGAF